jgi:23S rRNA-/tRNA-specific pseudouridylate synthase
MTKAISTVVLMSNACNFILARCLLHSSVSVSSLPFIVKRYCSRTTDLSISRPKELISNIQDAWSTGETDGIINLASRLPLEATCDVQNLFHATLDALPSRGHAAGALNAWIGACMNLADKELGAERAWQLLNAFDSTNDLEPSLVTYSLVYSIMTQEHLPKKYHTLGKSALDRAIRLAKKQGGSKRRKSLVASLRKSSLADRRSDLMDVYGISILHETDDFIILCKPSGMICAHSVTTSSGKVTTSRRKSLRDGMDPSLLFDISLESSVLDCGIPLSSINVDGRGLVHRIDRGTSGCVVLAKNDASHAKLVSDFFLRNIQKTYLALVTLTNFDIPSEGMIDIPVQGHPAISYYSLQHRYDNNRSLFKIRTLTGRKHQVRIHCAQGLKAPIVGDTKFLTAQKSDTKERFCLHASTLQLPNNVIVEAPLPEWWFKEMNNDSSTLE